MDTDTIRSASELWDYMSAGNTAQKSDAIVVCCSYDLRVCDRACNLIEAGYSDVLVLSGGSGNWTRHLWNQPEARVFLERAVTNGMDEDRILLETGSTNFGENIAFSRNLVPFAKTVTFVTKPNSLLRAGLTARAQWPDVRALVSCPDISFPDEVSNIIGVWGVINEMVGDIDRIQRYPALGYQAHHKLPARILEIWKFLVDSGFTCHLVPDRHS
jgi:uncharacterized SAM-binding protein YcdF (DUF218 family)